MPYWIQDPGIVRLAAEGVSHGCSVAFEPPLSLPDVLDLAGGRALTPEQKARIPRILRVSPSQGGQIPDILSTGEIGPWIVSQRLRDKIEEIEPGVHDFVPVTVRRNDEPRDYGTCHLILLIQSVNAVVVERTKFQTGYGKKAAASSGDLLDSADPDITLDGSLIAGHHLWRGGVLFDHMWMHYFCSDELAHFVMEHKLTGWRLTRCNLSDAMHRHFAPRVSPVPRHREDKKRAGREIGPFRITAGVSVSKEFDPPLSDAALVRLCSGNLPRQDDKLLPWEVGKSNAIPSVLLVGECRAIPDGIPDIMGWSIGPWIVSQRLRDKLEELEPEVHKFLPLEVRRDDDSRRFGTYHLILLTASLDAIIFEKTKFSKGYGEEAAQASAYSLDRFSPDIHLKKDVIAGHHLWKGDGRMSYSYFCSHALGQFIIENDMAGWDLASCRAD